MNRTISINHNGKTYAGQVVTIKSTRLGWEDHGILSAMLHCEYPGGGQGVGGFCLDMPVPREERKPNELDRVGTAYGLDHLMQVMWTAGVDRWEKLPGTSIIMLATGRGGPGSISVGFAHLTDDKRVFILKDHADQWSDVIDEAVSA